MKMREHMKKAAEDTQYRLRRFQNERIGAHVLNSLRLGSMEFSKHGKVTSTVEKTAGGGRSVRVAEQIDRAAGRIVTRTTTIAVAPPDNDYYETDGTHIVRGHQVTDRYGLPDAERRDYAFGGSDWDPLAKNSLGAAEMGRVLRMVEDEQRRLYETVQPDLRGQSV